MRNGRPRRLCDVEDHAILAAEPDGGRALIVFVLAAIVTPAVPVPGPPFQVLAGPAFESFAARTDARCPGAHARFIKPAGLAFEEEGFQASLSASEQAKFNVAIPRSADGGPKSCEDRDGLSCPASRNLEAIARAHQMKRFIAFVCASKAAE